jgi:hypothetical protein
LELLVVVVVVDLFTKTILLLLREIHIPLLLARLALGVQLA